MSFLLWAALLAGAAAAVAAAVLSVQWRRRRTTTQRFRDALQVLMHTAEGSLYRSLHPRALDASEKPLVHALQRAIHGQLGKPETVCTRTLEQMVSPSEGMERAKCLVEFEKGNAMITLTWECDGPPCGPHKGPRLVDLIVLPEDRPLDLAKHVLPESLEQKTDDFIERLFAGQREPPAVLCDKLKGEWQGLKGQCSAVVRSMGGKGEDPEPMYHASEQVGPLARKVTATLKGEGQDAGGEFLWGFENMKSTLLKFSIQTVGKAHRETVFVNPDGSRYVPDRDAAR
eukprot:TRINITY_DN22713_c0_g1_i1.p2 TRINITY_DN22713_c0_g1~~TRINITY_DN22713_c0_g1_i1.p2  ORF type:complete len:286 (+),score=108.06 TRINITY_DN22713_c0_g1_i1:56-913(+)